jgi:isoleucyl-tRNA synthetase
VWEANPKIIAELAMRGNLVHQEPITHSYPHCWRCKEPVIFRATPQWFLSVERQELRKRLLDAVKTVNWIPSAALARISGMLETRPDWCLSRQRYWGTPIPALHCDTCDQPLDDPTLIRRIEEALAAKGIEAWFSASPQELVPGVACPRGKHHVLRKETDILDVWFDSGVSHEAVLRERNWWPAQLYLEGSDQHRGWFQVSLIPAVALSGRPPYEQVLTHGFVMDGQGRKMSKSLGNVVAPQDVMERYGADILRLWVASSDYREDVRISDDILGQVAESYRKIRNTFRYLLANLYDFDPTRDRVRPEDCDELDRWALHRTRQVLEAVTAAYEACQFHEVARVIYQYCVVDLSAFYLDALKDRLYTEGSSTKPRRCAQTVLYDILGTLVRALAPILALTTDEVWQLMRKHGWVSEPSVHLSRWPEGPSSRLDADGEARWATVLSMRDVVMKALEDERGRGLIGSPLEARVTLLVRDAKLRHWCEAHRALLAEALVVSGVEVQADGTEASGASHDPAAELVAVRVERAPGQKCGRCWKHLTSVGQDASHPSLCERCARVVTSRRE